MGIIYRDSDGTEFNNEIECYVREMEILETTYYSNDQKKFSGGAIDWFIKAIEVRNKTEVTASKININFGSFFFQDIGCEKETDRIQKAKIEHDFYMESSSRSNGYVYAHEFYNPIFYYYISRCFILLKHYSAAVAYLKHYLYVDPIEEAIHYTLPIHVIIKIGGIHYHLGKVLNELGEYKNALDNLFAANLLYPDNILIHKEIIRSYKYLENQEKVKEYLGKLERLWPIRPTSLE